MPSNEVKKSWRILAEVDAALKSWCTVAEAGKDHNAELKMMWLVDQHSSNPGSHPVALSTFAEYFAKQNGINGAFLVGFMLGFDVAMEPRRYIGHTGKALIEALAGESK